MTFKNVTNCITNSVPFWSWNVTPKKADKKQMARFSLSYFERFNSIRGIIEFELQLYISKLLLACYWV